MCGSLLVWYVNELVFLYSRPHYSVLGHVSGTELYLDVGNYKEVRLI